MWPIITRTSICEMKTIIYPFKYDPLTGKIWILELKSGSDSKYNRIFELSDPKNSYFDTLFNFIRNVKWVTLKGEKSNLGSDQKFDVIFEVSDQRNLYFYKLRSILSYSRFHSWWYFPTSLLGRENFLLKEKLDLVTWKTFSVLHIPRGLAHWT